MKRVIIIVIVALVLLGGAAVGVNWWMQSSKYVTTENARIAAPLIAVSNLSAAQIIDLRVDIGDHVEKQQIIAEVGTPRFADSASRQGFSATPGSWAIVQAPVSGYVAAVWTYPGAMIGAGSPIVTLFDDSNIWVTANIDETQVRNVKPGQPVDVIIDSLGGQILKGKVEAITPSTAASFSMMPQANTSGNYIKVAQVIPVKITLDYTDGIGLIPGSSVEVKILVK